MDEAVEVSPWIALPGGRHNLGIGRHWHFCAVVFWVLNGLVYLACLFGTGEWRRLVPTSWDIFPAAWQTFLSYATLHLPPAGVAVCLSRGRGATCPASGEARTIRSAP